ncbi:MAG: CSLREA domain-containing protein [Anaerolineaceae bacterium]|nr:CSLREA domain-containing protein [Anaerolineaceae bacterium]
MNKIKCFRIISACVSLIFLLSAFAWPKATSATADRATWLVNSLADDDDGSCAAPDDCTLREAINLSNSGDIINFESALAGGTINLTSTLIIDNNLTIENSDLKNKVTLNGQGTDNIMDVNYGISLTVKRLTFLDGFSTGGAINSNHGLVTIDLCNFTSNGSSNATGGALYNNLGTMTITRAYFSGNEAQKGGAIYNYGHLIISDSFFENNSAVWRGGAIFNSLGSITDMNLEINNSTFSGNTTDTYEGGAINNESHGPLEVTNSTFEGNSATADGGGIYSYTDTDTKITHSTFSGNSAGAATDGGGIHILGSLRMYNSILSNSVTGYDCYWNYIDLPTSINNLIMNNAPSTTACGTPLLTNNPNLGALVNNGGFTQTMALPETSPAVDQGHVTYCETEDQRGVVRPSGPGCDLGAYEYEYPDTTPPVVSSIVTTDPNPTYATQVHYTVTFSEPVTGVTISDFNLRATGLSGHSLGTVSGSGAVYTVTANTGSGIGTLRLDVIDDDTILDLASLPLGGVGEHNGNFDSGEKYMVRYYGTFLPFISR